MKFLKNLLGRLFVLRKGLLCPVCNGRTRVTIHKWPDGRPDESDRTVVCPGCNGKGLIPFGRSSHESCFAS